MMSDSTETEFDRLVWVDPGRCSGIPCVRGTRVWLSCVTELIDDCTDEFIVECYPTLTVEQVSGIRALWLGR